MRVSGEIKQMEHSAEGVRAENPPKPDGVASCSMRAFVICWPTEAECAKSENIWGSCLFSLLHGESRTIRPSD